MKKNQNSEAHEQLQTRHLLFVRINHWVNAIAFICLVVSGIGILVAHPQFYWGQTGYFGMEPWLNLGIETDLEQTGWGRNIHFLFAWVFVINGVFYLVSSLLKKHLSARLLPTRHQLQWANIRKDLIQHLKFKHSDDHADSYNFLQKIAYLIVLLVLCPLMLLTGLTMAPGVIASFPELLDIFGGRQSARTIHFICASALVIFLAIHLFEILLVGAYKEIYAMIMGRYPQHVENAGVEK